MLNDNNLHGHRSENFKSGEANCVLRTVDTEYLKIMYETFSKFKVLLLAFHATLLI
jgi:hypothetical protein